MMIDTIYAQVAGYRQQELLAAARVRRLTRHTRGVRRRPAGTGRAVPAATLTRPAAC